MTIGNVHSDPRADERGRPFWLPPGGWGNGLEASAWVALAAVAGEHLATLLLADLREAGVPAYAATVHHPRPGRARPTLPTVRIWVGADHFGTGEAALLRSLSELTARYGDRILR